MVYNKFLQNPSKFHFPGFSVFHTRKISCHSAKLCKVLNPFLLSNSFS